MPTPSHTHNHAPLSTDAIVDAEISDILAQGIVELAIHRAPHSPRSLAPAAHQSVHGLGHGPGRN